MANQIISTRFIMKNDTEANWISNNPVLLKGEIAISIDKNKFKFGLDNVAWNDLEYVGMSAEEIVAILDENRANIYEGIRATSETSDDDAIAAAIGDADIKQGDMVIISTALTEADDEGNIEYSYIGFVYNGEKWVAMDGNVNADNVILTEDIVFAGSYTQVGNVTKTNTGTYTMSGGISVSDFIKALYTKTEPGSITGNPSVTTALNEKGSYEVGTKITPTYSATLSAGSYKFGPATGITAKTWSVKNSADSTVLTTSSGTFPEIQVVDNMTYKVTATATYDAGALAYNNMKEVSVPNVQIAAGSKSDDSDTITGYRKPFWGYKLTADALADPKAITSDQVRALQKSGTSTGGLPTSYTIPADTKQVYFLAKAGTKTSITVKNASALNAPVAFTKVASAVEVEGANDYIAVAYDLWYADFDAGTSGSADLTITWA